MRVGTDVVDIERMHDVSEHFIQRVYTQTEIDYMSNFVNRTEHLAGFFCAKEAFLKALGGDIKALSLKEIEVNHTSDGEPFLELYGKVKEVFETKKEKNIAVSISHSSKTAIAVVNLY